MRKYRPKEVCKLLKISYRTLIRWDKSGKLMAYRTETDRRYYTKEQIDEIREII